MTSGWMMILMCGNHPSAPVPQNENFPLARLPTAPDALHCSTMAEPLIVSLDMPDCMVSVTVCLTIATSLFSGVPLAGIRCPHDTDHSLRPARKVRHVPVEGDAVSILSHLTLISHDFAPAIAVPFILMMRFLP